MTGKEKCRILKELRREIAEKNDLTYVTSDCKHQGECRGTCPKCEAELRDLERQADARARAGKALVTVGLSAGLLLSATACDGTTNLTRTAGDLALAESGTQEPLTGVHEPPEPDALPQGGMLPPESTGNDLETEAMLAGEIALPESDTSQWELMGDLIAPEPVLPDVSVEGLPDGIPTAGSGTAEDTWSPAGDPVEIPIGIPNLPPQPATDPAAPEDSAPETAVAEPVLPVASGNAAAGQDA